MAGAVTLATAPVLAPENIQDNAQRDENERWFDALDYRQPDGRWFDALEDEQWFDVQEPAQSIPLSEDCRRSLLQLIHILSGFTEGALVSVALSRLLPGLPGDLLMLADSLYRATLYREDIDLAALNTLGLLAHGLPEQGNPVASLAGWLRNWLTDALAGAWPLAYQSQPVPWYGVVSLLAVASLTARSWLAALPQPQRRLLRLPAGFAQLMLRASYYWRVLGRLAQPVAAETLPVAALALSSRSEFIIEPHPSGASQPRLHTFSANATLYLPSVPGDSPALNPAPATGEELSVARCLHSRALAAVAQRAGIRGRWSCRERASQHHQQAGNALINRLDIDTHCQITLGGGGWTGLRTTASGAMQALSEGDPLRFPAAAALPPRPALPEKWHTVMRDTGGAAAYLKPSRHMNDTLPGRSRGGLTIPGAEPQITPVSLRVPESRNATIPQGRSQHPPVRESDAGIKKQLYQLFTLQANLTSQQKEALRTREGMVVAVLKSLQQLDAPQQQSAITRAILAAGDRYGAREGEAITDAQQKNLIGNWLIESLLGTTLPDYLARSVAASRMPGAATLGDLHQYLDITSMLAAGKFDYQAVPLAFRSRFNDSISAYLKAQLPLLYYFRLDPDVNALPLNDPSLAALYHGSRHLYGLNILEFFSKQEVAAIGQVLFERALSEGAAITLFSWLLLPAALFSAQRNPEKIRRFTPGSDYRQQIIEDYLSFLLRGRKTTREINVAFNAYLAEAAAWRTKGQLAEEIIKRCPVSELGYHWGPGDFRLTVEQRNSKIRLSARERYLLNNRPPCASAPADLNLAYRQSTEKVAAAFRTLDGLLLASALEAADKDDLAFIFSTEATIYPTTFTMDSSRTQTFSWSIWLQRDDIKVQLEHTDLLAVRNKHEERVYGLKALHHKGGGYQLIRLDRDPENYIRHGVLDYKDFGEAYEVKGNKVKVRLNHRSSVRKAVHVFTLQVDADRHAPVQHGVDRAPLLQWLQQQHYQQLVSRLHHGGNDKPRFDQALSVLKSLIPFYDCVEGAINKELARSIPSCMLDTLAVLPLAGRLIWLGGRFGAGLLRGLYASGLTLNKNISLSRAGHAFVKEVSLPTLNELGSLGKNLVGLLDPGFSLVSGAASRGLTTRVLGELQADIKTYALGRKLASLAPLAAPLTLKEYRVAHHPESGLLVPIKNVGRRYDRDIYVMVDPLGDELFGKRYHLYGDELIPARYHYHQDVNQLTLPGEFKAELNTIRRYVTQMEQAGCSGAAALSRVRRCVPPALPKTLAQLPPEMLEKIFSYLPIDALSVMAQLGGKYEASAAWVVNRMQRDRPGIVDYFIEHAIVKNNVSIIRFLKSELINPAADFLRKTNNGNNIVTFSAVKGNASIMRELTTINGIDINHATDDGNTALMIAASADNMDAVAFLLALPGINLNHINHVGSSALTIATIYGRKEMVEMLLRQPAIAVNQQNLWGYTPLTIAIANKKVALVNLLLAHPDINVNAADVTGTTALMLAASHGESTISIKLMRHPSINTRQVNNDGLTASQLARANGHKNIALLIWAKENCCIG